MQLSAAAFEAKWAATLGQFADNTTRLISEGDLREFAQDIKDSFNFNVTSLSGVNFLVHAIGDWDMDTNASASAWNTGIPIDQFVSATFHVVPDSDVFIQAGYQLGADAGLSILVGLAGPNIIVTPGRAAASAFDSTDFNATGFNRGYIILAYNDGGSSVLDADDGGTGFSSYAVGDILYADTTTTLAKLSVGSDGEVLTLASGLPSWAAGGGGGVSGLTTNRVPYATSATTLGDDSGLTWDATNNALTVGVARFFTINKSIDDLFIGEGAGNFTTTGVGANTGVGRDSMADITTGQENVAVGYQAGETLTTGASNTIVGSSAGAAMGTSASQNTFLGHVAGQLVSGSGNICVGNGAGITISGDYNIALGVTTMGNPFSGDKTVIVGYGLEPQSNSDDGQLSIQNAILGRGNTATSTTISDGIIGLYSTAAIGSWQRATFIGNMAAQGTAIANGIVLYSKDSSDGSTNSTLALYTEQAPEATATFTQTHRIKVWWNGVEYWLSLDAV
jgi:hypothetical protein